MIMEELQDEHPREPGDEHLLGGLRIHPDGYLLTHLSANLRQGPIDQEVIQKLFDGNVVRGRIQHNIDNESLYFAQWGRHDLFILTRSIGLPRNALQTFSESLVGQLGRVRSHHHAFAFRFEGIGADPFDDNASTGRPLLCLATLSLNATLVDFYGIQFTRWAMSTIQKTISKHDVVPTLLVDLGAADIYLLLFTKDLKESYDLIYWELRNLTAGRSSDDDGNEAFGFEPEHLSERLVTLTYSSACFRPKLLEKPDTPPSVRAQLFPATINIAVEPGDEKAVDDRFRSTIRDSLGPNIRYEMCHVPGEFDLRYTFFGPKDHQDHQECLKLSGLLDLRKSFVYEKGPVDGIRRIMTEYTIQGNDGEVNHPSRLETLGRNPYVTQYGILEPLPETSLDSKSSLDSRALNLPSLPDEIPTYFYHSIRSLFVAYEEYLRDPLFGPRVVSYYPFINHLHHLIRSGLPNSMSRPAQTQFFTQILSHVTEAYRNLRQGDFRETSSYPLSIRAGFQKLIDSCYGVAFEAWNFAQNSFAVPDDSSNGLYPLILFTTDPRMRCEDYQEHGLTVTRVGLPVLFQFSDAAKLVHEVGHVAFRALFLERHRSEIARCLRVSLSRIIVRNLNYLVPGLVVTKVRQLVLDVINESMPDDELVVRSLGRVESYTPHVDRLIDILTTKKLKDVLDNIRKPTFPLFEEHLEPGTRIPLHATSDYQRASSGTTPDDQRTSTSATPTDRETLIGHCRHAIVRSMYRDVERLRIELAEVFSDVFMATGVGWSFDDYFSVYELDADLHLLGHEQERDYPRILRDLHDFRVAAVRFVMGAMTKSTVTKDTIRAHSDVMLTLPVLKEFKSFFDGIKDQLEQDSARSTNETAQGESASVANARTGSASSEASSAGYGLLRLFRPLANLARDRYDRRCERPPGQQASLPSTESRAKAYLRELDVLLRFHEHYRRVVAKTHHASASPKGTGASMPHNNPLDREFTPETRSYLDRPKPKAESSVRQYISNKPRFAADANYFLRRRRDSGCVVLTEGYLRARFECSDHDFDGLWTIAQETGVGFGSNYDTAFRDAHAKHELSGRLFCLDRDFLRQGVLIASDRFGVDEFERLVTEEARAMEISLVDLCHGNAFHFQTTVYRGTLWSEHLAVSIDKGEFLGECLEDIKALDFESRVWANQYLLIKTLCEFQNVARQHQKGDQ